MTAVISACIKKINLTKSVNFCVAILILKMEETTHVWCIMVYCFKKGKNATEMQKKTGAVSGEGAVTDRMCQKWFVKFRAGDFSLNGAPSSGTPAEVYSNHIETLIENSQHYARGEIADMLKISKSIKLLVKMKNVFSFRKQLNGLFGQPNT